MIKEWAAVIAWDNGMAQVSCDVKTSCNSCSSRAGCGTRVLNKLGPQTSHASAVPSAEPLVVGQKVELGITESSLLSSAMLINHRRCSGCLLWRRCFRSCSGSDIAALSGAILGGVGSTDCQKVSRLVWRHGKHGNPSS